MKRSPANRAHNRQIKTFIGFVVVRQMAAIALISLAISFVWIVRPMCNTMPVASDNMLPQAQDNVLFAWGFCDLVNPNLTRHWILNQGSRMPNDIRGGKESFFRWPWNAGLVSFLSFCTKGHFSNCPILNYESRNA